MFCKYCGGQVGEGASFCRNCGASLVLKPVTEQSMESSENNWTDPQNVFRSEEPAKPKGQGWIKRHKKLFVTGCCATGVIVAGALSFIVAGAQIKNFFRSTFSSPESYMKAVIEENYEGYKDALVNLYDCVTGPIRDDNSWKTASFSFKVGDGFNDVIDLINSTSQSLGLDLSLFKSFEANATVGITDDSTLVVDCKSEINGETQAEISASANMNTDEVIVGVPSETSSVLDLSGVAGEQLRGLLRNEGLDYSRLFSTLREGLPDPRVLGDLYDKYYGILLESIRSVEKYSGVVDVDGIAQNCTELCAVISPQDIQDMMQVMAEELAHDEVLRECYSTFSRLAPGVPSYEQLMDTVAQGYQFSRMDNDMCFEVITDVDSSGHIIGCSFMTVYNGQRYGTEFKMPVSGSEFALEINSVYNENKNPVFSLRGEYKGGKISGSLSGNSLEERESDYAGYGSHYGYNMWGYSIEYKDIDLDDLRNGKLNGTLILSGDTGLTVSVDVNTDFRDFHAGAKVMYQEYEVGNADFFIGDGSAVTPPKEGADHVYSANNPEEISYFLMDLNEDKIIEKFLSYFGIDASGVDFEHPENNDYGRYTQDFLWKMFNFLNRF